MAAIVVVGSVNADMILRVDRLPRPGETVLGSGFTTAQGGKGANQAVAARRAGGSVSLVARVGSDQFGHQAIDRLTAEMIDTRLVFQSDATPSGVALIFVDDDGENTIGVAAGANATLRPDDIRSANRAIASADLMLVQLETPIETVDAAISAARANGVSVILNPAPACPLSDALLRNVSILTPNHIEAEALTGVHVLDKDGARRAADALHDKGIETVMITMGADGVFVSSASEAFYLAAHPVKAIDATAAGDAFNGALAVALAERRPLREAARFANAAAALSVTRMGAQPSIPNREEIEAFLRQVEVQGVSKL